MNEKSKRGSTAGQIVFIIAFIVLALYAATLIFTFGWSILSSFKSKREYNLDAFAFPTAWLKADNPVAALFGNYVEAFNKITIKTSGVEHGFVEMTFNSLWYALFAALLPVLVTAMTSYVFAKYEFFGKKVLYTIAILIMMIPIMGNFPAAYRLYFNLGITNSPLILITSLGGFGSWFLIFMASFQNVSWSYAESAEIDGANNYVIFLKIMLPQVLPAMFTLFILNFIGTWNDYLTPYLYLKDMPTLATGLFQFEKQSNYKPNWPVYYAGVTIMAIPILLIFIFFSDKIMSNVSMGGLKG